MLTGKQKRYLRSLGQTMEPIIHVGKNGIGGMLIKQVEDALEARELIKGRVLQNCLQDPKEVANEIAEAVDAEVVQVIGRNFLLYRPSEENRQIELPV
ncbi:ribosome assembly RNA-binding protein YhbY [Heliorestis acidaminivorans]|uniref:Ribosome assembly RNA-binding protein YhbY n=1 Tax=Heliorestis acidaminivorans TaxID=553427 RepID=A0A6I0ERP8_9FIRM|nr:ribosome assembly RNA-binding protein YhbY [Heliorestis acidaminivorans]KAB2952323.1 ribosome assembly RNA-binding protein YhbY [Heliorestis acidaminivorans]